MKRSDSRGFTTILAVVLLGLVGTTATLLVRQMEYESKRTRTAYEDAQLRQLLIAGSEDVIARSATWGEQSQPGRWTLGLPTDLATNHMSVVIASQRIGAGTVNIHVTALTGARKAEQMLQFERHGEQWSFLRILPNTEE